MCKSYISVVHVCMGFKEIVIMNTFIQIFFTFVLPSYKQKSKYKIWRWDHYLLNQLYQNTNHEYINFKNM